MGEHHHQLSAAIIAAGTTNPTGQRTATHRALWTNPHLTGDTAETLLNTLTTDTWPGPLAVTTAALLPATENTLNRLVDLLTTTPATRHLSLLIHTLYQRLGPLPELTTHMHANASVSRKTIWALDPRIDPDTRRRLNPSESITALYNTAHTIDDAPTTDIGHELDHVVATLGHYTSKQLRIPALLRLLASRNPDAVIALATPRPQLHHILLSSAAASHLNPRDYLHGGRHDGTTKTRYGSVLPGSELIAAITNNPYLHITNQCPCTDGFGAGTCATAAAVNAGAVPATYTRIVTDSWRQHFPGLLPAALAANPPTTAADASAVTTRILTVDPHTPGPGSGPHYAPMSAADRHTAAAILTTEHQNLLTDDQHHTLTDYLHTGRLNRPHPHRDDRRNAVTAATTTNRGWHPSAVCVTCTDLGTSRAETLTAAIDHLDNTLTTDEQWNLCHQLADHFTGTAEELADTVTAMAGRRHITTAPSPERHTQTPATERHEHRTAHIR